MIGASERGAPVAKRLLRVTAAPADRRPVRSERAGVIFNGYKPIGIQSRPVPTAAIASVAARDERDER